MNGGKFRIEGRVGNLNDWVELGDQDISGPDFQDPYQKIITISDDDIKTAIGTGSPPVLEHNTTLNFRAYNIDKAENISSIASPEASLDVDIEAPSLVQFTSNQNDGHYK